MPKIPRARTGALRISRSAAIGCKLSLADYGLRDRIWLDLRWTPATVRVGKQTFNLLPGQAVVSLVGYAEEFGCHRRVLTAGLTRLAAAGWFLVDSSPRGTVVTCLRDPRDGSDLDLRPKGGGCPPCGQASAQAQAAVVHQVDSLGCPPDGQAHIDDAVVPHGGSAPNNKNGPGVAVKPSASRETARARDDSVAEPPDDPPPKGGRPAPLAGGGPVSPPPPGVVHSQTTKPQAVASAVGYIFAGRPEIAHAAGAAGVPLGLAAALAVEHCGREAELLAWLWTSRRRRPRSAAALVRWALAARVAPPAAEFDAAKRALRGLEPLPRAATSAARWTRRTVLALAARLDAAPSYASPTAHRPPPTDLLRRAQERLVALGRPGLAARLTSGLPIGPMRPSGPTVSARSA